MRIAVVTTSYPTHTEDPSGHFVRAEVRSLLSFGHEVTLFAPRADGRPSEPGVRLVELPHLGLFGWPGAIERMKQNPWTALGSVPFIHQARRKLKQEGPFDELIAHWAVPGFWPICRDFEGVTTVVVHGSDVGLVERLPRSLQRRVLTAMTRPQVRVRTVSADLRARLDRLTRAHALALRNVRVAPAALDTPTLPDKEELRRVLGLTKAPLVVVVGRVVKDKRIDIAIEATRLAFGRAPTIIGDGPERAALMKRHPDAEWLGQLPRDMTLRWIKAAHVLLSASLHEGAPTVVREARTLGTPVVAVAAGDLKQWAEDDPGLRVVDDTPGANPVVRLSAALQLSLGDWQECAASAASLGESAASGGVD
jgi:glycosyltransferase involved in cell wall biosynthesis